MAYIKTTQQLKEDILGNFDFAFKVNWEDPIHRRIHIYLTSLTMYFGVKMNGHISTAGSYLAYRFNERDKLDLSIDKFRKLFKNQNVATFNEEYCNGCYIFTF